MNTRRWHVEPGKAQRLAALVVTMMMIWFTIPEHQRRLIVMRAASRAQRAAGQAARREGHRGMGEELAGRAGGAERAYGAAYQLSRARDRVAEFIEEMRP